MAAKICALRKSARCLRRIRMYAHIRFPGGGAAATPKKIAIDEAQRCLHCKNMPCVTRMPGQH